MTSLCGPCSERATKTEGTKWCQDCQEMLCAGCSEHHQSLKLTKSHHLVDASLRDSGNVANPPSYSSPDVCVQHPPEVYQFYCRRHDSVLCQICVSTFHQPCGPDVMPIDAVASGTKSSSHLLHYEQEIPKLLQGFGNMMVDKQRVQREFIESASDAKRKMAAVKFDLQQYINDLEQKGMEDLNSKERDISNRLLSEIQAISNYEKEGVNLMSELRYVQTNGSDKLAFVLMQKLKNFFKEKCEKMKELSYTMQSHTLQADIVDPAVLHGKIGPQLGSFNVVSVPFFQKLAGNMNISNPPQPQPQHTRHSQPVSATNYTQQAHLDTGKFVQHVTVLDDGTVVLGELNVMSSSRLYFFTENGQQVNEIKLPSSPTGIAAIPGTTKVAALVGEEKIMFFDKLQYNVDVTESETINMASGCSHIAAAVNRLCVCNGDTVIVMDMHGKYIKTLKLTASGVQAMCVNDNGDVYYALKDKVYCMKECGEEICLYFNNYLLEVSSLTVDGSGNVYVCGKKSKNIHVVRPNGTSDILLRKENGVKKPKGIYFDQIRNKLFIDHHNYDPVQIFEIK